MHTASMAVLASCGCVQGADSHLGLVIRCLRHDCQSPLQALVDDWGFAEAAFRQFAGPCFQHLATFLKSANELDSQLQASDAGACAALASIACQLPT